ncbi:MAG: transposase [Nitrospirae bacterium]|nr:transposase [Nitrospirota bacterium]
MPRQARLDAPGTLHHIIIRGIERRRIVDDRNDRANFLDRLERVVTETKTSIYAWALMTNHAHFLLRSGPKGLAKFMRQFLTGYAISYNRRHRRHGHVFQNRYKSIVCDENKYFTELVRYIHLNPLRAGVVKTLAELDGYRYSGHSVLVSNVKNNWQERDYVLNWFGDKECEAIRAYREYVEGALEEGNRPELVGGGLIRSLGGWSEVLSMRRRGERKLTDERILGSGDFVLGILEEAEHDITKNNFSVIDKKKKINAVIKRICSEKGVSVSELRSGGRREAISGARNQITFRLIKEHGISFAEVARNVGVSTSAIFRIMKKCGS